MKSKRILVTGAAGFIGSNLVDRLLADGHEVVGLDSFTEYYDREFKQRNLALAMESEGFGLIEGDLLDLELRQIIRDFDCVVHLAAEPGVRSSWDDSFSRYLDRNVLATQRLLEALRPDGSQKFVFASSSSVYGSAESGPLSEDSPKTPASPYGLTKLAAEELIWTYSRQADFQTTILRYFTVYGPRQRPEMALSRFISSVREGRPVEVYGDGEQEREFTFVSDIVEGTVAALSAAPGTYNIGGGSRSTVNELISVVSDALDTEADIRYGSAVRGDVRSTWADLSLAKNTLGYTPKVDISKGVREQVEWSQRNIPLTSSSVGNS